MKNIIHNVSRSLRKTYDEKLVAHEIDEAMDYMLPFIKEAEKARELYFSNPSIQNGARRHELEQKAKNAIEAASQHLWETWEREFKEIVTECEFVALILQALKRLHPQGEEPTSDE
jgi:hypothetical protein